jgi:hypothetical protein
MTLARIDAIFSSAPTKKGANSQLANVVRATATPRPPLGGEVVGTYCQWRELIAYVGVGEFPD